MVRLSALLVNVVSVVAWWALRVSLVVRRLVTATTPEVVHSAKWLSSVVDTSAQYKQHNLLRRCSSLPLILAVGDQVEGDY